MKNLYASACFIILVIAFAGCGGKGNSKNDTGENEISSIPDTGFTGIKKYMNGELVLKEVTFKNSIREGVTKTYDMYGRLYQTFWYKNGLKEDSSCWYFPEGQLFRTTPYKHDTIDGIQKQYYRTGELRARIGFRKGYRTELFEEYNKNGKLAGGYPEIIAEINDHYASEGIYQIGLRLSDKNEKVKFFRGEFTNGVYDTTRCKIIKTISGKAALELKKAGTPQPNSISILAEVVTPYGNKYLATKKINLPYNDLK